MTIQEEEKQEMAIVEEEDDDGPPPGFQCIITPPAEADDDDGPPPGFCSIAPKPYDTPRSNEHDNIDDDDDDDKNDDDDDDDDVDEDVDEDDDDGPPPGWGFSSLVDALPIATSCTADIKEEDNEESDDGPPPGWELPCQMPPPHTPSLQPPSTVSSSTGIEKRQTTSGNVDEVPPSESQHMAMPMPGQSSPATPSLKQPPSSELPSDAGNKDCNQKYGENKLTSWHKPAPLPQQLSPAPAAISSSSEKCQLVCGTCRKLCLYPRGAKWVQCPGCQEVNFVLEAHEVGQVKCGGCSVLLMYAHGAPAVECSSCRFVTQIGLQNRRAPLSVQQAQARAQAQAQRRHRHSNRAR